MILIIDDDSSIRLSLGMILRRAGYEVDTAENPDEALAKIRDTKYSLILMDMNFRRSTTGEEGIELLRKTKIFQPETPVILITAWGSIELAVEGMRAGAYDFITKPWHNIVLLQRIETALSLNSNLKSLEKGTFDRCGIIGKDKALEDLLHTAERISATDAPVLILGENGTGKEMVANAIHQNSRRKGNPFVMVNLGGISRSLFETEMFGHAKGAFTGAITSRKGRFEVADKGTIFLDEIGELDLASQVKLLRVLQQHTFEPLGESRPVKVDIRVVCATNADLSAMVAEKTFREDLFYRINLITLRLPPLRERRGDIPMLVRHFIKEICEKSNMELREITPETMEYLTRLPYPGNIRQLKNMVERAILTGGIILKQENFIDESDNVTVSSNEGLTLEELEKKAVEDALEKSQGNHAMASRILGVTRQTLYRRMDKYGLR